MQQRYDEWDIFRLQGLSEVKQTTIQKVVGAGGQAMGLTRWRHDRLYYQTGNAQVLLYMSEQIYEPVDHFLGTIATIVSVCSRFHLYSVEITGFPSTITERPDLRKIRGMKKAQRSFTV